MPCSIVAMRRAGSAWVQGLPCRDRTGLFEGVCGLCRVISSIR